MGASSFDVVVGRFYLAQSNLPYAYTAFANASDPEGKVLKGLTSLALLQRETNTVNLLNKLHYTSPANIWQVQTVGYQQSLTRPTPYRTVSGTRGAQLVSILRDTHLPVLAQAETDLAFFTDNSQLVPLGRSETGNPDINLDRGDILMIRSLLACGRFLVKIANSQNIDVVVNDYLLLDEEPGSVTIEKVLSRFPDLARLANSADLPFARNEAKNAITLYKQASEWIRSLRSLGVVRLFNLPGSFGVNTGEVYTASLADEAKFRAKLDEYAALLDGSSAITGFDNGPLDTFNGKPFFDGFIDLRATIPFFRKNKIRQGEVTEIFAKAGGVYPNNTVTRTESWLLQQTVNQALDPFAFGLFVPPHLSFSSHAGNTISEGYQPAEAFIILASRAGDVSEPISVLFYLGGTSTHGLDYQFLNTSVTFLPGNRNQFLPLEVVNDNMLEFDETITLTGTPNLEAEATIQAATLTILDDDGSGVGIVATDNAGKEGRLNPDHFGFRFGVYDPIRFEVRRTGSTAAPISVKINRDALLSSTSPDDYEITGFDVDGQSIRIPAGSSSAEIVVSPKFDINYPEGTESLTLRVTPDPNYTVMEASSATGSIADSSPYEWWSYQMGLLVANQSPALDVDGDGMPNLLEMALGRDPNLPDSANTVLQGRDADGYLTLSFKRWTGGINNPDGSYTQYGVTYTPQGTSSLESPDSWTNSALQVMAINDSGDGMEQVTIRDMLSKTQTSRFLRLKTTISE